MKYIPDAGCSYEQLKQHDADAFHRRVFRHCCRLWINRTIDLLFLRSCAGCSVLVLEANATIGGGARSAELTLPGFVHDLCSAVHPLAAGSPFFKTLPLDRFGLTWIQPDIPLAHPLDDGTAAFLHRDVDLTAAQLNIDGPAYGRLLKPLSRDW
ncbi:MAG: hypothetical protein E6L08_07855 [Verrucomicrobia bacterium]|nr:MAG: hypothetical protein E6L08_07855 [Verrucomicrobiota bacterium]